MSSRQPIARLPALAAAMGLACVTSGSGRPEVVPPPQDRSPRCGMCVLQRPGHLPSILRRAIGGSSVPSEEVSYGHCFVCVQCAGEMDPSCWGWWPLDPDGGDFAGDPGKLELDADEKWTRAECVAIEPTTATEVRSYVERYAARYEYQVINRRGGRSCLGFCTDVADQIALRYRRPAGDLTIPGNLEIPEAALSITNRHNESADELMFRLIELGWDWRAEWGPE